MLKPSTGSSGHANLPRIEYRSYAIINHVHVHDALWPICVVFTQGIPLDAINVNLHFLFTKHVLTLLVGLFVTP